MNETILSGIMNGMINLFCVILGGVITWFASIHTTNKNIKAQNEIIQKNSKEEERKLKKEIYRSKKMLYADIISVLYEAIRVIKNIPLIDVGKIPFGLAFNNNYSELISNISDDIGDLGIITLNRFYGLLEKIRNDIMDYKIQDSTRNLDFLYLVLLVDVFSENYKKIIAMPHEAININSMKAEMTPMYKELVEKLQKDIGHKENLHLSR